MNTLVERKRGIPFPKARYHVRRRTRIVLTSDWRTLKVTEEELKRDFQAATWRSNPHLVSLGWAAFAILLLAAAVTIAVMT